MGRLRLDLVKQVVTGAGVIARARVRKLELPLLACWRVTLLAAEAEVSRGGWPVTDRWVSPSVCLIGSPGGEGMIVKANEEIHVPRLCWNVSTRRGPSSESQLFLWRVTGRLQATCTAALLRQ